MTLQPTPTAATRRVLIVDDNHDAADTMSALLKMAGHECRAVYCGADAVACAVEFRPHVILLDLAMPSMDGYKVAASLRKPPIKCQALIIAVTGYGQPGDRARGKAAGVDVHLLKPADPNEILRLIAATPGH